MKSYFSYFKIPFIILAILAVISVPMYLRKVTTLSHVRSNEFSDNSMAVYDYAGKMTATEVDALNELIQYWSEKSCVDIAVVTLDDAEYGYLYKVKEYADDFAETKQLGFTGPNTAAIVFVDNWSRGGDGYIHSWISTEGELVKSRLTTEVCENILNVPDEIPGDTADPYEQYVKIVNACGNKVNPLRFPIKTVFCFGAGAIAAGVFIALNWKSKLGDNTVTSSTYLKEGSARFPVSRDMFSHKTVTKRKIERSSSGGGGGGGGGRGGGGHSR